MTMESLFVSNQSLMPTSSGIKNQQNCSMDEELLHIPFAVLYSLIFLFGLIGNLLALWVFFVLHSRKNSVRVFLINVALADLVLIICLPFRVLYHSLGKWPLGTRMCKAVGNLFYMNMYVSITLLGFISLDRYIKIQSGKGSLRGCGRWLRGNGWSKLACGALWVGAGVAVVPMIALAEGNEESEKCFQYKKRTGAAGKAYFNAFMVAVFWLVFLLLVASYCQIAWHLLQTSLRKPNMPNAGRYSRTARKSFVVLFLFTVCFVPYHSFRGVYVHSQLTDTSCEWQRVVDRTNEIMLLLSSLNSCLDPVMYFMLSGSVRKATVQAARGLLRRLRVAGHHGDSVGTSNSSTTQATTPGNTPRGSIGHATVLRCKLAGVP
ncbi:putative G-protein coupled receptor 34a [Denticeps clupeoides]|uniref:Probable G-protein coupled receptor 34 n=1 Tax=Denticeps clupeoides TaxID=299321 RepID=A0AAY4DRF2_9TELE|nr:probable G-protein coupled receptor 34 [Denticeps clupeoides]